MTHEEIQSITMDFLKTEHLEVAKFLGEERLMREAGGIAGLARMEMEALIGGQGLHTLHGR